MPTVTGAREAVEALDEPWLEHFVVGRSLCLHQPVTRAVALLPDAAREGAVLGVPSRAELVAAGLVLPSRDEINSAAGTLAFATRERPWCEVGGSRYWVRGGAVVSLTCDCAWLAPRLEAVLSLVEWGRTATGVREVSVTISVGAEGDYDFRVDRRLVRMDVARANARRLALNIVLVEALRHLTVGAVLHGAAVGVAGRAALLAGGTGAGKSTLALGLAARGFEHLSDDFIPFPRWAAACMPFHLRQA